MIDIDWKNWSNWTNLGVFQCFGFLDLPSKPGAYVVAASRPITRAVDIDNDGILTIGETDDLRRRIQIFADCAIAHGNEGHMAGWRYAFLRFQRHFPYSTLRIRWKITETKQEANELEGRMLLAYLANHLELPPLNYKFNWQALENDGYDLFDKLIGINSVNDSATLRLSS